MSPRAFGAVVRLTLMRQRMLLVGASTVALLAFLGAAFAPRPLSVVGVAFGGICFGIFFFVPVVPIVREKMQGLLEFDRTLPHPLSLIAAARLTGTTVRTAPVLLGLAAIGVFVARRVDAYPDASLALAFLAGGTLYLWLIWVAYAFVARFTARIFPFFIWPLILVRYLLPERVKEAMEARIEVFFDQLLGGPSPTPATVAMAVAGGVIASALVFAGANRLLTSALYRFQANPTASQTPLGALPRTEMGAIGRGPLLAMARLRLRLAGAHLRPQLIIFAVLIVLLAIMGPAQFPFARRYAGFVAFFIPMAIGIQLTQSRAAGSLEGIANLPHSRRLLGVGNILAVMALALVGVAMLGVVWEVSGDRWSAGQLATRWLQFTGAATLFAGIAVWGTLMRTLILIAIGIFGPLILVGVVLPLVLSASGVSAAAIEAIFRAIGGSAPSVALVLYLLAIFLGNEFFARGLARPPAQR